MWSDEIISSTYSRVKVLEGINITPVPGRVFVSLLESTMVVFNDGVKQVSKSGVRLSIRSVDTHSWVMVFQTWEKLNWYKSETYRFMNCGSVLQVTYNSYFYLYNGTFKCIPALHKFKLKSTEQEGRKDKKTE